MTNVNKSNKGLIFPGVLPLFNCLENLHFADSSLIFPLFFIIHYKQRWKKGCAQPLHLNIEFSLSGNIMFFDT